jgi:hypothetical protein
LKRVNSIRLAEYCSMSWSRPDVVVVSAALLISSKCSLNQTPNSRASRALGNRKTGARCIRSSTIVVVTPPASCSSRIPRL